MSGIGAGGFRSRPGIVAFFVAMAAFLFIGAASAKAAALYDQYNNAGTTASLSQDFEASNDGLDSQLADDFVVPAGQTWSITGVDVDGQYFGGAGPAPSVNVTFYDNASGDLPGAVLESRPTSPFTGAASGDFVVSLDTPVTLSPGTYWVSVQARMDYSAGGEWGWQDRTSTSNAGAAFENPGGGFMCGSTWVRKPTCVTTANGADQVFRLNGTVVRPLTVSKDGAGSGTVTTSPAGIDCGADCSEAYNDGSTVTLTATPAAGSSFAGWSGDCSGRSTCTLSMNAPKSATATFYVTPHGGYTTRTSSGATIVPGVTDTGNHCDDCTTAVSFPFPVSFYDQTFTSGRVSSNGNLQFAGALNSYHDITDGCDAPNPALAGAVQAYQGDLLTDGPSEGIFTTTTGSAPHRTFVIEWRAHYFSGGSPRPDFELQLHEDSPVITVVYGANADNGSHEESGIQAAAPGATTQFSCHTSTLTSGTSVDYVPSRTLTVGRDGSGSGTVSSNPAGIDCGGTCAKDFDYNTSVTLAASPAQGSRFAGWSGGGCSGTDACTTTVDAAKTVTATFTQQHTLTVATSGSGSGAVSSDPAGIECGATCSGDYDQDASVTLTPTAAGGSSFTGWSGDCSGTAVCTVAMGADKSVTATFTLTASGPHAPDTSITKSKVKKRKRKATFEFTGSGTALPISFQCKLDDAAFAPCTSPVSYKHLSSGKHTFEVAAKDSSGQLDPTPASQDFKVKRKHQH